MGLHTHSEQASLSYPLGPEHLASLPLLVSKALQLWILNLHNRHNVCVSPLQPKAYTTADEGKYGLGVKVIHNFFRCLYVNALSKLTLMDGAVACGVCTD